MSKLFLGLGAAAVIAAGAMTMSANAAYLSICDNPGSEGGCPTYGPASGSPDPYILFTMNDFEGSFQINGVTVQSGLHNPATFSVNEGTGPSIVAGVGENDFSGTWIDLGHTTTVNRTIFFINPHDPAENGNGFVSDVLHYTYTTDGAFGHLDGSVLSDVTGGISIADLNAAGIFATGPFVSELGAYNFSNAFITAGFQSGIPEPSTWAMMMLGFAGLGFAGYRKASAI
jgi:PEP-CTERM motif